MIPFSIELTRPAILDLNRFTLDDRNSLLAAVSSLREDPFPDGRLRKKLKGFGFPVYRLRTGSCRILYRIDGDTVTILRFIDRRDLERTIRRLR